MFKILLVAVVAIGFVQAGDKSMKAFNTANIPADLGINAPPKEMKVEFAASNVKAKYGNSLKLSETKAYPVTEWQFPEEDEAAYFTLVGIDLDAADSCDGTGYVLWLVTNICLDNVKGDEILGYKAPSTAGNRIAFLVFYQSEEYTSDVSIVRESFDIASFAKDFALTIWSGNFFYSC